MSGGRKLTLRAVAEITGLLVIAFGMIYISRVVGPEYVGYNAITSAVLLLLGRLADGGLTAQASQILARDEESINTLLTTIALPKFLSAFLLVILTLGVVALLPLDATLKYFLNVAVWLVFFEACTPAWVFVSLGWINVASVIRIVQSLLFAIAILVFIRRPDDWHNLPYLTLFNSGINFTLAIIFLWHFRLFKVDRALLKKGYLQRLGRFYREGYHFLKADLSGYVYTTSDRLILYYFTDSHTVGIYEAAYKIINPFYSINGVITPTMFRDLAQSFKQGNIHKVMTKYVFTMCLLTIPLGFYLLYFSDFVVTFCYGTRFAESASSLRILGFVITFGFTSGIIAQPFCVWNMQREFGTSVFWGNVLNTVMNFTLIPFFGAVGAAMATLGAKIIVTIVSYIYFSRVTDYPIVTDFGWFFIASTVPLVLVIFAAQLFGNPFALTALYGVVYFALVAAIYQKIFRKRLNPELT